MNGRVWFGAFAGCCAAGIGAVASAVLATVATLTAEGWARRQGTVDS